jgi:hypothetical protein
MTMGTVSVGTTCTLETELMNKNFFVSKKYKTGKLTGP